MAEKLNIQPEAPSQSHEIHSSGHEQQHHKQEHQANHAPSEKEQQERLNSIRNEVGKQAQTAEKAHHAGAGQEKSNVSLPPVKRQLQAMMRDRTLKRIRKELPVTQRALSKFVHAKPVEAVSAVGEKTIARPYGLLGGGFCALAGSIFTFYMARNYGFRYNLFLFFTFFVAGYILATVLEAVVRVFNTKK